MAKREKVASQVRKMVAEQLGKSEDEVVLESSFIEDLGADSLDLVELIMTMEDEYGIEISDEEAEGIITVKDAIEFIVERTEE